MPVLAALCPRPSLNLLPPARAREILEGHLTMVAALAEVAIAEGWDTGRITLAGDGAHPFADEVAGLLGRRPGRADSALAAARTSLCDARQRLRALTAGQALAASPLDLLCHELRLTPLAMKVLLVVAAPSLWPELARVYAIAANDAARPLCDPHLVYMLLKAEGHSRWDVASELTPAAPLVRQGVLEVAPRGRPCAFAELTVAAPVVERLRGDAPPARDGAVTLWRRGLGDGLIVAKPQLAALVSSLRGERPSPLRLVLTGRLGSGRRTLAAALAASAGRPLGIVDVAILSREPASLDSELETALSRVWLRGWLPCVTGLERVNADAALTDRVRHLFRRLPFPVILRLARGVDVPLDPGHDVFDLPDLDTTERAKVWRDGLQAAGLDAGEVAPVAERYTVGPGVILRAAGEARALANESTDGATAVRTAMEQHFDRRIGRIATRVKRLPVMADLVLPPDMIDSIRELIARIRHRHTVFERWGLERVASSSRGTVALFQGGPGTGKTMVAGVVARELGIDLYRVDLSRVVSKWLGETEQNLTEVFDAAQDGHAVILFDEADALFAKRTEVRSSHERYANMQVNHLLQQLDSFEGIAVLTTNLGGSIDSAFRRRVAMRLTFPFPSEEERERLWRVHLPPGLPVTGDLDLAALARRYKLSGGYIRNAVLRTAFLAAQEQRPISQELLERAVCLEYREVGKLSESGQLE